QLSVEHVLGGTLKIKVDGRYQVVAWRCFLFFQLSHFPAEAVDDDTLETVLAAKDVVVLALQTCLSDLITRPEIHKLRRRQLRFGHFTDITQRMCCQFAARVAPSRLKFNADFRQFVPMRFHKRNVGYSYVFLQQDGTERRLATAAIDSLEE